MIQTHDIQKKVNHHIKQNYTQVDNEKKGNDCQPKKFRLLNKFSLSAPKKMYREQYGENGY